MDKKKAVKLATASAVAASAFVAANPHASQAATDVATVVSQAKAQFKAAYYAYSHTVTETGKLPNISDVYAAYNKAKQAYANAVAVVNKAGGAKKDAYLADLQATYEKYVFKANPKSGEARAATYIDAYNYAVKLDGLRQDLAKAVEAKDLKKAEELYHKISYELRTRTVILDRVYGQTTRELLRSQFKTEAQKLRDSLIYDITVAMKAREAQDAVKAGNLDKAKAALDQVNQYVSKVTDAFKAELQKAAQDANAAYEAALTPKVESVSAITKTKVEVTFNKEVDSVKAENFTIEGASVDSATLSADKKKVTLEVSGLDYDKTYTLKVKVLVNGQAVDFGSKEFKTPAVTDLWKLEVSPKSSSILANGADNTVVTFKLIDKVTGQVDKNADNIVLDLNTTYGSLAHKRVTIQDGQATVVLTSEFSNKELTAKIDAQIIEASGDYKDLIGKVAGTAQVSFVTSTVDNVNTITLVSAEANQADRLTLFFDKEVSLKHFVQTNGDGELLYTVDGKGSYTKEQLEGVDPKRIAHKLYSNAVVVKQGNTNKTVKGLKPVPGNAKAIEVILDKDTVLTDNQEVNVEVNTVNSIGKVTKSNVDFKLTDARQPEVTSVSVEGLNTLKVKFSEAVTSANYLIDGQFKDVDGYFTVQYGEFNPVTLVDNRDLATLTLNPKYKESDAKAKAGYFTAGKHSLQVSTIKDFAALSDSRNIGTTQNLTFEVAEDTSKPSATVKVESPEQFRVTFDKAVKALNSDGTRRDLQASDFVLQYYDETAKVYKDVPVTSNGLFKKVPELVIDKVSDSEYVLELNKDWTEVFNTKATKVNYYNHKFQLVVAADKVINVANGEKNNKLVLDLNYSGSPLNTPDTTSPVIKSIDQIGKTTEFVVTLDEPVKLADNGVTGSLDNAGATLNEDQTKLPETSVQFIGKDKDGKTVTLEGIVAGYADSKKSDAKFIVKPANGVDLQAKVDSGEYAENWTVVVKSLSDDVGNTAATLTKDFKVTKSVKADTPFYIVKAEGSVADNTKDVVVITFSEGVQYRGGEFDATSPSQYTLNGKNLPIGTSITVEDGDSNTNNGLEKVVITLPDGTLNATNNVITVNKNLVSYDGSVLILDYEKVLEMK